MRDEHMLALAERLGKDAGQVCVRWALQKGFITMPKSTKLARIKSNSEVFDFELSPEDITEETLSGAMYTAGQPDPDLIIRPSGEERISNFLLWQSAYTEFEYFDILWPDFKPKHLDEAIEKFNSRQRRFGGV